MEFDETQEPPIFKADFDRVMLEMKQQQDEASEQRKEMKRVLEELVASYLKFLHRFKCLNTTTLKS